MSQRLGIIKVIASEINRFYKCDALVEKIEKAKNYFKEIAILVNTDNDNLSPYFQRFKENVKNSAKIIEYKGK